MRRHIFYVHGFDPRGPAPYQAIATEAAAARGYKITPRRKAGAYASAWEIRGPQGEATHEFLRYDDLVRELWPRWNGLRRPLAAWRVLFSYWRAGVFRPLACHAPSALVALWLQALTTLTPFALMLGLGALGWRLATYADIGPYAVGGALAAAAAPWAWRRLEAKISVAWFTRSLAYFDAVGRGEIDLSPRTEHFAERIAEVWRRGEADEVLVVGHSVGATLAVEALARALELAPEAPRARLALRTLGQSIPIYLRLDRSGSFALRLAAVASALRWTDVTSRRDSASSGAMPIRENAGRAIRKLATGHIDAGVSWRQRAGNPLEFHFNYLRPQDPALGFDYLTALLAPVRAGAAQTGVAVGRRPSRASPLRV